MYTDLDLVLRIANEFLGFFPLHIFLLSLALEMLLERTEVDFFLTFPRQKSH